MVTVNELFLNCKRENIHRLWYIFKPCNQAYTYLNHININVTWQICYTGFWPELPIFPLVTSSEHFYFFAAEHSG